MYRIQDKIFSKFILNKYYIGNDRNIYSCLNYIDINPISKVMIPEIKTQNIVMKSLMDEVLNNVNQFRISA